MKRVQSKCYYTNNHSNGGQRLYLELSAEFSVEGKEGGGNFDLLDIL
jgi:hypothetical protein